MCTIIDMNILTAVFNPRNSNHDEFKPIFDWIYSGKGKMVFGGSKYIKELGKLGGYRNVVLELNRKGKVVKIDDNLVDEKEKEIENDLNKRGIALNDRCFNDAHLVAIVAVSKVKIITSNDLASINFLRDTRYYNHCKHRPVFYTRRKNVNLLQNNKNYSECCS